MAENTKKMRLGTCVTNPASRDITVTSSLFATLNLISDGRMQLGIGRGDSSRRVLGKKPVGAGDLERAIKAFRDLTAAAGNQLCCKAAPIGCKRSSLRGSIGGEYRWREQIGVKRRITEARQPGPEHPQRRSI